MSYKHPFIVTVVSLLLICNFNLLKLLELGIFQPLGILALVTSQMLYVQTATTHFPLYQTWFLNYGITYSSSTYVFLCLLLQRVNISVPNPETLNSHTLQIQLWSNLSFPFTTDWPSVCTSKIDTKRGWKIAADILLLPVESVLGTAAAHVLFPLPLSCDNHLILIPLEGFFFIRIWWEEFPWRSQLNLASSRQASVNRGKNNLVPWILHTELRNSSLAPRACPSPSLVCFSRAVLTHLQQCFPAQRAGVDCWPWGGRSLEEHVFMIMESFQHWDFVVYSNKWSFSTCSLEVILFPWAMF